MKPKSMKPLKVWRCSECGRQLLREGDEMHWHPELGDEGEFVKAEEVEVIPLSEIRTAP